MLPPAEEANVISVLSQTGRGVSRDVVELYCITGGMKDGDSAAFWALWSMDRVVSENANYERPYLLFADYLINTHCYCFKYLDEDKSSVHVDFYNGEEPKLVADSVTEFFRLYLTDPERLEIWDLPPRTRDNSSWRAE